MSNQQPWRWPAVVSAVALSVLLVSCRPASSRPDLTPRTGRRSGRSRRRTFEAQHGGGHDDDDDRDGGKEAKKRRVKPVLDCVIERAPGRFVAVFGYVNSHHQAVAIPVGTFNRMQPAPQDRGQPGRFQPGRHRNAFRVEFTGGQMAWFLADERAAAFVRSERCAAAPTATPTPASTPTPPAETGQVSPVLECVIEQGAGRFTAVFRESNANAVAMPIGKQNRFHPAPEGRGSRPPSSRAGARASSRPSSTATDWSGCWAGAATASSEFEALRCRRRAGHADATGDRHAARAHSDSGAHLHTNPDADRDGDPNHAAHEHATGDADEHPGADGDPDAYTPSPVPTATPTSTTPAVEPPVVFDELFGSAEDIPFTIPAARASWRMTCRRPAGR